MKLRTEYFVLVLLILQVAIVSGSYAQKASKKEIASLNTTDMDLTEARVRYMEGLDLLIFEMQVEGTAGNTTPEPAGQMNGASVLGYVFPTTLSPTDVGFGDVEGILAFAVTSHPDFDDTPLWDEDNDLNYENDGQIFHTHWVVLVKDKRVAGGLAVKEYKKEDQSVVLPPTNPGMPMYLDSPGFSVVFRGHSVKVAVPAQRVNHKTSFNYDGVAAYMEVSTGSNQPMLGVYSVFEVLSGDLSLPYGVQK
ncbi:hypothetical protein NC796_25260 [Aliifodinibius sp. S!AR15-10]|uniref:hypothetical protein n=1 Tax=Aliifodinibius sp. S!AR15-10 TaxID=2950437 RepID=UPI00285615BD|nr:hypothetical protein [Aliifodinibius sp. S!AR15-10]MDR8394480.1 hypothetical protein [Aliifodinibius sp. S!AR15-10]